MFFFFCGAPKHGSHFQLYVVTEALKQRGIDYEIIGDKAFNNHRIDECESLLRDLERQPDRIFVNKGHWSSPTERSILLTRPHLKVFHIWRDIRDVMVSLYHYRMKRYGETYRDFDEYYWRDGRSHFLYQTIFRKRWETVTSDRIHHTSYTGLRTDFANEAGKLLAFAGVDGVDLAEVEERVSLSRLRKKNDPKGILLRRGAVGEGAEVITSPRILADMDRISGLNLPRLHTEAIGRNPKILFKGYMEYPGKSALVAAAKAYRRVRPRKDAESRSGPAFWWS